MSLSAHLRSRIEGFLIEHDLASLYRQYNWTHDTWENGFPEMRGLERDLGQSAKQGYLTRADIMRVATWGRLRNTKGVQCPERVPISLYGGDDPAEFFRIPPSAFLKQLRRTIKGMGPTYLSKVLMFSRPKLYGAIDTRLVRVFGVGDAGIEGYGWLSLTVRNDGSGWYIPERQKACPDGYDTWIEILHHIAGLANRNGQRCPHPRQYASEHLRDEGVWVAADVETALFSHASRLLKEEP